MNPYAVIVAGGRGTRMHAEFPKQFMLLEGKPVLLHSILKFIESGLHPEILLVLPEDQFERWSRVCSEFKFEFQLKLVAGGETRYHSVKNALKQITADGIIAIHDAVRPLVSKDTILTAFHEAERFGNAIPVVPLKDSIRKNENGKSISIDRTPYFSVQTPQCFKRDILNNAYSLNYRPSFTDDASVVEASGVEIHTFEGKPENIKITDPLDLSVSEFILKNIQK